MAACCGTRGVRLADEPDSYPAGRVWPWALIPGGETKWMPLSSCFSAVGFLFELPVEKVRRIIEYNHRFGPWQTGPTGAPPGSGVALDTAAARHAVPALSAGHHPVLVLCGQENNFGPQILGTHWSFGELQYLVPFCTNATCEEAGYPALRDVQWTYRITAMETSLLICVGSWQQFRIPCSFSSFAFDPPLVRAPETYYGRPADVLPGGNLAITVRAHKAGAQSVRVEARAAGARELPYDVLRREAGFDVLATIEQPWFSDPTLQKWGAYNFDLDRSSFKLLKPTDIKVQGAPDAELPQFVDSAGGLRVLAAMVCTVPFRETSVLHRRQLSLLEAVRARKADPGADVDELLPAEAFCCGVGCVCGPFPGACCCT